MKINFTILFILSILYCGNLYSQVDSSIIISDNHLYGETLDSDLKYYISIIKSDSIKSQWINRKNELIYNTQQIIDDLNASKKYYKNDEVEVFAFLFLRNVYTYEYEKKTELVNDLGHSILLDTLNKSNLRNHFITVEAKFEKYAHTKNAQLFHQYFSKFNKLKTEFELIENPPIKLFLRYEPKDNAYQTNPDLFQYKLFDWKNQIDKIIELEKDLNSIELNIKDTSYLVTKDETPWITLFVQLIIFASLFPTFLLTYKIQHNPKLIMSVVALSLISSGLLIYFNPSTWQNILFSGIIPALFYIYFIVNLKNRVNGDRISPS